MTRAQHRAFSKLRKKQVNKNDVSVVEINQGSATFYVTFPGLYLTYGNDGKLLEVETITERAERGNRLAGSRLTEGEMGSDTVPVPVIDPDDDVPF